jgi:hypothetical protein
VTSSGAGSVSKKNAIDADCRSGAPAVRQRRQGHGTPAVLLVLFVSKPSEGFLSCCVDDQITDVDVEPDRAAGVASRGTPRAPGPDDLSRP